MRGLIPVVCGSMLALWGAPLHAQQAGSNADTRWVEVFASSKALEARYGAPTSFGGQPHSAFEYALFLSEDRDFVGSAAFMMGTELNFGWQPLQIHFGPQAYFALVNQPNTDVFSLAIGIEARYELIPSRGIAIAGHAYYSPDILTFGSADQLTDYMARGEIGVTDKLILFGGYRWFRLDLTDAPSRDLQNQVFAGVRWQLH